MPFEKFDLESLDKERRKAIAKSIRTINVEELKKLGEEIFRYADDPWRETFFRFIAENAGATFHHAATSDGVNILYCRDQRSEEHTSELQSLTNLVCRLLLEKKKK